MRRFCVMLAAAALAAGARAAQVEVTGILAVHRHGQTFVTWKDAAGGEKGAGLRYAIYRSDRPIAQANLARAEKRIEGVFNNSAKLYGFTFAGGRGVNRLDPELPNCVLSEGGEPLPEGSGVGVVTVERAGRRWYAVVATDLSGRPLSAVVPGQSATTEGVEETVAPIRPIRMWESGKRKHRYGPLLAITGRKGLPLMVSLHASGGYRHTGGHPYGDYYLFFGRREWGYREGLPGVFAVQERKPRTAGKEAPRLELIPTDAIVAPPAGERAMETYWFGYRCVPQWAEHAEPRAYPFTERRLLWMIEWTLERYGADRQRVYCSGGSMGAWGTSTFALRHGEIFAAVYPNRPRTRQRGLPSLAAGKPKAPPVMDDGKTPYARRMDMVRFVSEHHEDLPFLGWCCGRRDGFASWAEQVQMVEALTKNRHGFAFAWNDGDHSSGSRPMREVLKDYPPERFARNRSYPAFGNSSIDGDLGSGEAGEGDMEGGINLGFSWKVSADEPARWSATISNRLCTSAMTVDVTPRRCRKFKPAAGRAFAWTASTGDTGRGAADRWGLATARKVTVRAGAETVLTITLTK